MPVINVNNVVTKESLIYPPPFDQIVTGRKKQALGNAGNLDQFGVNLTTLAPGAASAMRHWHENEDEFIFVLKGRVVLIEDRGESELSFGDCAAFKAGVANAHQFINKSDENVELLEIGTRCETETAHYPDAGLKVEKNGQDYGFFFEDGRPYEEKTK